MSESCQYIGGRSRSESGLYMSGSMLMMSLYPLLQVHRGANWPRRAGGVLLVSRCRWFPGGLWAAYAWSPDGLLVTACACGLLALCWRCLGGFTGFWCPCRSCWSWSSSFRGWGNKSFVGPFEVALGRRDEVCLPAVLLRQYRHM